jgi:hypothetical protein
VLAGPLEKPDRHRQEKRRRQQAAGDQTTRIGVPDQADDSPLGLQAEQPCRKDEEARDRVQSHLGVAPEAVAVRGAVEVGKGRGERHQARHHGEELGEPAASPRSLVERQGGADEQKAERTRRSHATRSESSNRSRRLVKEQLIDPEADAARILGQRQRAEQGNEPREHASNPAPGDRRAPRLVSLEPERRARDDEASGRIGLHRVQARREALEDAEVQDPAAEDG